MNRWIAVITGGWITNGGKGTGGLITNGGRVMRGTGRVFSPIFVAYNLYLAIMELECVKTCNECPNAY